MTQHWYIVKIPNPENEKSVSWWSGRRWTRFRDQAKLLTLGECEVMREKWGKSVIVEQIV